MIPAERRKLLINLISQQEIVSINQLVSALNVSHMTIRRDIQKLEDEGLVASVSGGVKALERLSAEPTHQTKSFLHQVQKANIGAAAAALIMPNQVVYLDAGTTTLEIARHLCEREDLLIVTNDFAIAHFLMQHGKPEIIHIGGTINKENYSSVGELAAQCLRQLTVDIAFVSTSSWNLKGFSTPDEHKLPVKRAIFPSSRKKILVSDSSKYGKVATFYISTLSVFDTIICDKSLLENAQDSIKEMNIELVLV